MPTCHERLRLALETAHHDAELRAALHGVPCSIALAVESEAHQGVHVLHEQPGSATLLVSASERDWLLCMQPGPPAGWHSFTAARRQGVLRMTASDLQIAQCLHALERCFEILRGQVEDRAPAIDRSSIAGRYVGLPLPGGSREVFVESSGNADAPVLLMLHTAGADARQYHALMADAGLQRDWHLHAFDMPGHGRSPMAHRGWEHDRLTREAYLAAVRAALEVLAPNRRTVLLGCSMGAAMALHAARELPPLVHGAVALEAPFQSPGRRVPWLAHAQVNAAAHNASYVRGLMGPQSPLAMRREAAWIYSQGGFGTYAGDLAFYSDEFDARRDVAGLDGTRIPVALLTGAYDYSATPADSRRVCELVPGARFVEMPELGHFPMTEHPQRLLQYLRPVLDRIRTHFE